MAIQVTHHGHVYTFRHPAGWSGGRREVREELNRHALAGDYPEKMAEEMAIRHALEGILAGGEAVDLQTGKHLLGGRMEAEGQEAPVSDPDRIVREEGSGSGELDSPAGDPDRILED